MPITQAQWTASGQTGVAPFSGGSLTAAPASSPINQLQASPSLSLGQANGVTQEYWDGAIDEVIIEDVAWSASKVKKYYTNSLGRFATL